MKLIGKVFPEEKTPVEPVPAPSPKAEKQSKPATKAKKTTKK